MSWSAEKQKWQAHICVNQRRQYLGRFDREEDAARAYDQAAVNAWGLYARINGV